MSQKTPSSLSVSESEHEQGESEFVFEIMDQSSRAYDQLKRLMHVAGTDCGVFDLKKAFLFTCLRGLVCADVSCLRDEIIVADDGNWEVILGRPKYPINSLMLPGVRSC
jgi:hypothetical protein